MQVAPSVRISGSVCVWPNGASLFRQLVAYIYSLDLYILWHLLHRIEGCSMRHNVIHKN